MYSKKKDYFEIIIACLNNCNLLYFTIRKQRTVTCIVFGYLVIPTVINNNIIVDML